MIFNLLRILLIIILVLVVFIDVQIPDILTEQINQLIIAIFVILIIVVVDEIIGFLCGLIFLVVYFKYYQKKINEKNNSNTKDLNEPLMKAYNPSTLNSYEHKFATVDTFTSDTKPNANSKTDPIPVFNEDYKSLNDKNNCLIMPYISTELLEKAQNNIYDTSSYYTEIKKIDNSYGIQGLNSDKVHYVAYDKNYINNNFAQ